MMHALLEYYRCPIESTRLALRETLPAPRGFFRFGPDITCYGQCTLGEVARRPTETLRDSWEHVRVLQDVVELPFDLTEVVTSLRLEYYRDASSRAMRSMRRALRDVYYLLRPFMPLDVRIMAQRAYFSRRESIVFPRWPLDDTVDRLFQSVLSLLLQSAPEGRIPFIWFWPDGMSSCAVMTHDVETSAGLEFCPTLMDIDESWGIKSSFQIIPEGRYDVPFSLLSEMKRRGFEVNVHDLNHDGRLFRDRQLFLSRARKINEYAKLYGTNGFRAGAMYHKAAWIRDLDISYDMSIANSAQIEPQRGGCCTVMPFFNDKVLEIPLTTTQDWALFHVLRENSAELWKQEIRAIRAAHGLSSFITHPDYVMRKNRQAVYSELLRTLSDLRSSGDLWIAQPGELNQWWRQRAQMTLASHGNLWTVTGPGSERARIAYAKLVDGKVCYVVGRSASHWRRIEESTVKINYPLQVHGSSDGGSDVERKILTQ